MSELSALALVALCMAWSSHLLCQSHGMPHSWAAMEPMEGLGRWLQEAPARGRMQVKWDSPEKQDESSYAQPVPPSASPDCCS